jgi:RimJ/RimL family protein N-acetyltransferase
VATIPAGPQPSLDAAGGLLLRAWQVDDVPDVVAAYADPDIQRWHLRSMDEAEALEWIGHWERLWEAKTRVDWAVTDVASGTVLGRIGLRVLDLDEGRAEVSYWTLPAARGRGVAVAALETLIGWAFDELGVHRLELQHSVHNAASCRVAAKTGFPLEGVLRDYLLHQDGWHDVHQHGRVASGPRRDAREAGGVVDG